VSQPTPGASSSPDDRAQTFEAQQGAPIPEAHSGEKLLVTAYAFIWVIAMTFVLATWFRQRTIARRIDELERAIDKAAEKAEDDGRMERTVVKDFPKREMD
jgi:hypothetical protein